MQTRPASCACHLPPFRPFAWIVAHTVNNTTTSKGDVIICRVLAECLLMWIRSGVCRKDERLVHVHQPAAATIDQLKARIMRSRSMERLCICIHGCHNHVKAVLHFKLAAYD